MSLRASSGRLFTGSTAEAVAFLRAAGTLVADDMLRGPDHLAARLIPWAPRVSVLVKVPGIRRMVPRLVDRILPGGLCFELARTRYMDFVVREEVRDGADQVVVLGAGYDSRAYRMADELAAALVFEVDHPAMSLRKRARVRVALGQVLPSNVRYVAVDLEAADLAGALLRGGYDRNRRAVVVWSGVTPYLEPATVDHTLRWMAEQAAGSCVVFDYCWQEIIDGTATAPHATAVMRTVASRGEPWLTGIPRHGVRSFLAERGLSVDELVDADQAKDRFLRRQDGSAAGPIWDFGGFARARVPADIRASD